MNQSARLPEAWNGCPRCRGIDAHLPWNTHHGGINNLSGANPVITGAVARMTKKAKILSLGTLVTVRNDPVRVAEEYATIDVLSGGRLNIGFVKSGSTEMASGDMQPLFRNERQWEALDLIEKTLTTTDGPFSWEGEHFTHSFVNIWPRPMQLPRPDIWMATSDPANVHELGRRGHVMVSVFTGHQRAKTATDIYKQGWAETHGGPVPEDRLGYCAFFVVGDSDAEARRTVEKLNWFHTVSNKVSPQFRACQPGFTEPARLIQMWRGGGGKMDLSPESLIGKGLIFAGTPDSVVRQVTEFRTIVGGLGHLVVQTKQGFVTHAEALKSYRLTATEVMPRLRELEPLKAAA